MYCSLHFRFHKKWQRDNLFKGDANKIEINVSDEMTFVTMAVIGEAGFGQPMNMQDLKITNERLKKKKI